MKRMHANTQGLCWCSGTLMCNWEAINSYITQQVNNFGKFNWENPVMFSCSLRMKGISLIISNCILTWYTKSYFVNDSANSKSNISSPCFFFFSFKSRVLDVFYLPEINIPNCFYKVQLFFSVTNLAQYGLVI